MTGLSSLQKLVLQIVSTAILREYGVSSGSNFVVFLFKDWNDYNIKSAYGLKK